jgi:hypothetical protein
MRWEKRGLVFSVVERSDWMWSHAQCPIGLICGDVVRVFFSTRDTDGRTRPAFVDAEAGEPTRVHAVAGRPLLDLGTLGAFDESGVMPSSVVPDGNRLLLFYVGWSKRVLVPYHCAIGVAASEDGGETFTRLHEGPIVERSADDPYFVTAPLVRKEGGRWRMWYDSCVGWLSVEDKLEPVYEMKYAESRDGLGWERSNVTCIAQAHPEEAIGPATIAYDDRYRMWFSVRGSRGFRTDPRTAYRIGYAESADGITWDRRDDGAGIERSGSGWDSVMQAYPNVYDYRGRRFLLYNGNGFGRSGFGYAVAVDE